MSQALLEGLEEVDTSLWKDIVAIQKHWIGDCTGCRFEFKIKVNIFFKCAITDP